MKSPVRPPNLRALLNDIEPQRMLDIMQQHIGPSPEGEYFHWDKLRHRSPPEGYRLEEWWAGTKFARLALYRPLPFKDKAMRPFQYGLPDVVLKLLDRIDRDASSRMQAAEQVANPQTRNTYIISSLIEEAITSSQLEGASTTRRVAKEMLREGRKPRNNSEQMIVNNYRAMQFIRDYAHEKMTPDLIRELHRIVVEHTLDSTPHAGVLRHPADDIRVVDVRDGTTMHIPPDAAQLEERLDTLCGFANDTKSESFIHPVIRAVILHFVLAYDHPFTDGNGRTARALFYWSLLNQGYWLAEYLSISRILKSAPSEYARAYLYTETDDCDVTYFIIHKLRVMRRALDDLVKYLATKAHEVREIEEAIRNTPLIQNGLNHRQIALLGHALRHPNATYRIQAHRQSHNVTYETARTDLSSLSDLGLLILERSSRAFVFRAPVDLAAQIKAFKRRRTRKASARRPSRSLKPPP